MQNRDNVTVILAGGEVVQRRDSNTERVPLNEEELTALLPQDLRERTAFLSWSPQPISHYTLRMCSDLTQLANAQVDAGGARGVVITCDTQALTELSYFASLVWKFTQPLIFTASIFSAGTSGSETELHIVQSVRAALSDICWGQGVLVCVQDALYSAMDLIHFSNFRRSGFTASHGGPLSVFSEPSGSLLALRAPCPIKPRRGRDIDVNTTPARAVEIVDASLGGGTILLNALLDKRVEELEGLVVAGFDDGDVPPSWVPLLRKIVRSGLPAVLCSRCPNGLVQTIDTFEGSASRLLEMGLINAGTLSPIQARIRLALALGAGLKDQELREYMQVS